MLFNKNGIEENTKGEELSVEACDLILEGMMQDTLNQEEILEFTSDPHETKEAVKLEILTERTIVKLDKYAKLSRAQKIAVFTVAREKKDPLWGKLVTVWKLERYLEATLLRKYGNEGMRRAKKAISTASSKPSPKAIKTAISRAKGQLNAATSAKTIRQSKDLAAKAMVGKIAVPK